MADTDMVKDIQKSQEGIVLGLGALAEVLQKMDARFQKQEELDEEQNMKDEMARCDEDQKNEKAELIKAVAEAVVKQLVDLQGNKPVDVGGKTKWPMSANASGEDGEKPVNLRTGISEVQRPIQAQALPAAEEQKKEPVPPVAQQGPEEFPVEEEKFKEYPAEIKMLVKELQALRGISKELLDLKASIPMLVKQEADTRLQKMGFREEKSHSPIMKSTLGLPDTSIVKSDGKKDAASIVEDLSRLSWRQICNQKVQYEASQTMGVPQEIAG